MNHADDTTLWGFLKYIRENPQDDAPRLIFTDYLQDAYPDSLWPSLIRHQVEYYNLSDRRCVSVQGMGRRWSLCDGDNWRRGEDSRRCASCRISAACTKILDHWHDDPPEFPFTRKPIYPLDMYWERGFIYGIEGIRSFAFWHDHGPELVRWHPITELAIFPSDLDRFFTTYPGDGWMTRYEIIPEWFAGYYSSQSHPHRKTRRDAEKYLSDRLLSWAREESQKGGNLSLIASV